MKSALPWVVLFSIVFTVSGCGVQIPRNTLLKALFQIMDHNMPPYKSGMTEDITSQVCPLVDLQSLEELETIKDNKVETQIVAAGVSDIATNSKMWIISRSKMFHGEQSIMIIFEPNGDCMSVVRFAPWGL